MHKILSSLSYGRKFKSYGAPRSHNLIWEKHRAIRAPAGGATMFPLLLMTEGFYALGLLQLFIIFSEVQRDSSLQN